MRVQSDTEGQLCAWVHTLCFGKGFFMQERMIFKYFCNSFGNSGAAVIKSAASLVSLEGLGSRYQVAS